jgi:hypothetical protein
LNFQTQNNWIEGIDAPKLSLRFRVKKETLETRSGNGVISPVTGTPFPHLLWLGPDARLGSYVFKFMQFY